MFGASWRRGCDAVLDEPLADELTRAQALRFAALLHDIGKPATRGELPDGRVTFIGHDAVGEEMVRAICRRLRTSERLRVVPRRVTRHHLVLGFLVHERPLSARAVYRYLRSCEPGRDGGDACSPCADRLRHARRATRRPAIAAHLELAREMMGAGARVARARRRRKPPLRGDELARELGIERGPELGRLLEALREAALRGRGARPR